MVNFARVKETIRRISANELPRSERFAASGLGALYASRAASWAAGVKNISSTGVYLATEKRLRTGEVISLTLLEEDKILLAQENPEVKTDCRISVHARVVRQGEDGLGLSFVLPTGLDTTLWSVMVRNIALLSDKVQIEEMFRMLRTILFECHLCQSEAEEAILLLGGQLNPLSVASLVKIAILAEEELSTYPHFDRMRIHPTLLARLLRQGSWAQDDLLIQLWAGLLVGSCGVDRRDDSNLICVDLLGHVGPEQAKIWICGCERLLAHAADDHDLPEVTVTLSAAEMRQITDRVDLNRPGQDTAYLYHLGLMENLFDFTSYKSVDYFDITPSRLGVELYKRCRGYDKKFPHDLVEKANTCLRTIFEQPEGQIIADTTPLYQSSVPGKRTG